MTRITRVSILPLPALVVALIGAAGCSSSNPPTATGVGGSVSHGTGGSTSTSTVAETTGGAATGTTGGAPAGDTGGAPAGDTGGAAAGTTGGADTGTTGGSTGAPSTTTLGTPLCSSAVVKNQACVAAEPFCYKTCGPLSSGFKTETCNTASPPTYDEQSGCSFPVGPDYSCYKIPTSFDASCPAAATPPQATHACTQAACVVCGTAYLDSGGGSKVGYCVCNASAANPTWSCASTTAWPCPGGAGCT